MELLLYRLCCSNLFYVLLVIIICRLSGTSLFLESLIADCYDPLDPNGNITVSFDILQYTSDGYVVGIMIISLLFLAPSNFISVTIQNFYLYRHVDKPGWRIGWTWSQNEVIWSMSGAFATHQGNCSSFKFQTPHSCMKYPDILDWMPDALPQNRSDACCKGGILDAWAINPSKSFSSFEMTVGNLGGNPTGYRPLNLTLLAPGPGYTCSPIIDTDPTVSSVVGGRREEQGHGNQHAHSRVIWLTRRQSVVFHSQHFTMLPLLHSRTLDTDILQCTDHMCPLRVHWHIKNNFLDHWRVKLTISNYNLGRNYSNWNVLVQHPGFSQNSTSYSFNSIVLPTIGVPDEVALFWGIEYYNDELLQADKVQVGSVTTEILLRKDMDSFTLRNGWAFPRRIYFNGENCEMPLPDTFPMLPNGGSRIDPPHWSLLPIMVYLTYKISGFRF
ncbi:unnamed protein product [Coffea canephora]|uniref:COBRA-like protein n=1 Tax=Coffea canephora TaxID=49390 RepID=A0A068TLZ0_COFCA|nr:unnamed protein product [Coffea canephora]